MNRKPASLAALALLAVAATACDGDVTTTTQTEEHVAEQQASGFLVSQPIPIFNWSQLRQNLIEIETAQANSTATTSFFFNQGVADPIMTCSSIGFAIPATYQLSNPDKIEQPGPRERGSVTIPQMESTGVYTADTTGTYVICVDDSGDGYAFYWEGFVSTVSGPATWNADTHQVELTGAPSAEFTTENP